MAPDDALSALASPTRRRIMEALASPRRATELARELNVTRQSIHEHLRVLQDVGLVRATPGTHARAPISFSVESERLLHALRAAAGLSSRASTASATLLLGHLTDGPPGLTLATETGHAWWPIDGQEAVMGRAALAAAGLPHDPFMSLRHARFHTRDDDWWIEDLASRNGTYVDDVALDRRATRLRPGATIRMGVTWMSFSPGTGRGRRVADRPLH